MFFLHGKIFENTLYEINLLRYVRHHSPFSGLLKPFQEVSFCRARDVVLHGKRCPLRL